MDETALRACRRLLTDGLAPRASALNTIAFFLHLLSHAFHPSFTLHSIIERDLSYVMYMLSLYLTGSILTCLAGLAGTRARSILG
jgi:hypothetical protein